MPGSKDPFKQAARKLLDEKVLIPKTKVRVWRFEFRAGGTVAPRGLRFYFGTGEPFPPLVSNQP